MQNNVYFEQCVDFLARMIEKYGSSIDLHDSDAEENTQDAEDI